jgi:hypothetical protein
MPAPITSAATETKNLRRMAICATASTWGKLTVGIGKLALFEPSLLLLISLAGAAGGIAALGAALVLRAAPDRALMLALYQLSRLMTDVPSLAVRWT